MLQELGINVDDHVLALRGKRKRGGSTTSSEITPQQDGTQFIQDPLSSDFTQPMQEILSLSMSKQVPTHNQGLVQDDEWINGSSRIGTAPGNSFTPVNFASFPAQNLISPATLPGVPECDLDALEEINQVTGFTHALAKSSQIMENVQLHISMEPTTDIESISPIAPLYTMAPPLQLYQRRSVEDTADSVLFAMKGDIEGLKRLFARGEASPVDESSSRGFSLIRACASQPCRVFQRPKTLTILVGSLWWDATI